MCKGTCLLVLRFNLGSKCLYLQIHTHTLHVSFFQFASQKGMLEVSLRALEEATVQQDGTAWQANVFDGATRANVCKSNMSHAG